MKVLIVLIGAGIVATVVGITIGTASMIFNSYDNEDE